MVRTRTRQEGSRYSGAPSQTSDLPSRLLTDLRSSLRNGLPCPEKLLQLQEVEEEELEKDRSRSENRDLSCMGMEFHSEGLLLRTTPPKLSWEAVRPSVWPRDRFWDGSDPERYCGKDY